MPDEDRYRGVLTAVIPTLNEALTAGDAISRCRPHAKRIRDAGGHYREARRRPASATGVNPGG
jgi:hypothetical protein